MERADFGPIIRAKEFCFSSEHFWEMHSNRPHGFWTPRFSIHKTKPEPLGSLFPLQKKQKMADYQPIDCNFYDELTLFILRKKSVEIRFANQNGQEERIQEKIMDIFTREGAEFLRTESELEIRLDFLLSVDGQAVSSACGF